MISQRTLKDSITLTGVGLHSGKPVKLTLRPARADQGIVFVRSDLPGSLPIPAHYRHVTNTQLATSIGRGQVSISTIEHLMGALQGAGVDNVIVEVDGPEIPIMDGSAEPFFRAIEAVGLVPQRKARPYLALRRKVEIKVAEKWAVAEPSSSLEIHGSIDWDHPSIGYQEFHYIEGHTDFSEISRARTFGFLRDVEALKRMGLARGGSLENAVVLDDAQVLNPDGLRYSDEFARHKVLDALGDLKLAGLEIHAYFRLHRAGHDLHSQILAAIFRDPDNYEIIDSSVFEERRASGIRAALASRLAATVG
ncbi:MAG: UDP-3-O-acyl-N-acetylglucosamine deacetylase [Oligoflexia bacterium]|nr:UDP-3-O-acyl-N-acetylglucosamine deacetylase [Oligoflexia bacterium]